MLGTKPGSSSLGATLPPLVSAAQPGTCAGPGSCHAAQSFVLGLAATVQPGICAESGSNHNGHAATGTRDAGLGVTQAWQESGGEVIPPMNITGVHL